VNALKIQYNGKILNIPDYFHHLLSTILLLVLVLFESLKSYDNNLYLGLINGKEEDKKTIKALIVTIKDEGLQDRGLEMFETRISAIIDVTTLSDDQLNDLIKQKEEELSTIGDENSREYSKFYHYIEFLKHSPEKWDHKRYFSKIWLIRLWLLLVLLL
jgi:hypothetical protein